ncbi:hypothetical protein TSUD_297050 [Trifolium subterraneum]|uniref:Uncharacterized protein n=1 Tax=Trifolium subterraneum TaxID=3900 RepID=A0A2Z6NVP4_TRISU|nr:hypothetical protein TSUD_297050 [Trifolium subterraneum]
MGVVGTIDMLWLVGGTDGEKWLPGVIRMMLLAFVVVVASVVAVDVASTGKAMVATREVDTMEVAAADETPWTVRASIMNNLRDS